MDLEDYNLVNFGAHYQINAYSKIQGKITNLLDEDCRLLLAMVHQTGHGVGVLFDF